MKINREIEDVKKIYKAGLKEVAIASGELIALKYPENFEIKRILSKIYFLCGQLDKAIQKLEEIILISSIDGEALFNLSIIYSSLIILEKMKSYSIIIILIFAF
jgi:tetratricopeptide (TPR) repeat protein